MRKAICFCVTLLSVICTTSVTNAKSWHIQMETTDGVLDYYLDEDLGAKMAMMPGVYVLVRTDQQHTVFVHKDSAQHAVRPWGPAGHPSSPMDFMTPDQRQQLDQAAAEMKRKLANLPPEARAYAEQAMQGKLPPGTFAPPAKKEYRKTGKKRKIGQYKTEQVLEFENGQPNGEQFWVAQLPDWERIAAIVDTAIGHMNFGTSNNSSFKATELGGLPVLMIGRDGRQTRLRGLQEIQLSEDDLSPPTTSSEVELMQLMQVMRPSQ